MVTGPCAFELFHTPPSVEDATRCLGKMLAAHARLDRAARGRLESPTEVLPPPLWLVSAGRPAAVLEQFAMACLPDWPPGIYRMSATALPFHVVVVSQLPVEQGTLMLRLMGARGVLRAALAELARLPPRAWERAAASEAVRVLCSHAAEAVAWADSDEKAIIMSATHIYEQIKDEGRKEGRKEGRQQGRQQGRKEGRKEGREQLLVRLLTRRFGSLPDSLLARIHGADSDQLDRWGEALVDAASLEEIFGAD
jgi:hypothetical protein